MNMISPRDKVMQGNYTEEVYMNYISHAT